MITKIKLAGYKKIVNELELNNFEVFNYLVGTNGSGKSSLIEGILCGTAPLLDQKSLIDHSQSSLLHRSAHDNFSLIIDWPEQALIEKNIVYWPPSGSSDFISHSDINKYITPLLHCIAPWNYEICFNLNSPSGNELDVVMKDCLSDIHQLLGHEALNLSKTKNVETTANALGLASIIGIVSKVAENLSELQQKSPESAQGLLLYLVEEPENSLHPSAQKLIPKILSRIHTSLLKYGITVQFLITTHSPFIISASRESSNTKVYCLQNGQCVDLEGQTSEAGSSGYTSSQSISIVNKMLGTGLDDLIPERIVFCEKSLRTFLTESLKNQLWSETTHRTYIEAGGDSQIIAKTESQQKIINSVKNTLSRNYLSAKCFGIIDQNAQVEAQADSCNQQFPESITILPIKELEEIYPEHLINDLVFSLYPDADTFDKNHYKSFSGYLKKNNISNAIKIELAEYVAKHITPDEFRLYCASTILNINKIQ